MERVRREERGERREERGKRREERRGTLGGGGRVTTLGRGPRQEMFLGGDAKLVIAGRLGTVKYESRFRSPYIIFQNSKVIIRLSL
jgi:hypothetical protein